MIVIILPLLTCFQLLAQQVKEPPVTDHEWTDAYEPFRVAGNLYYVGTYDLTSYLITTAKGHILINTGVASSASQIEANIKKLGFRLKDVKILLTNQVHHDHVGAMAELKKKTGAKLFVDAKDAAVLRDGGMTDYYFAGASPVFRPVKPDRLLHDGDSVSLGGTSLLFLHHPGHTKGSCSFLVDLKDSARTYRTLISNIPSIIIEKKFSEVTAYPGMKEDYAYTLDTMPKISFDIWVAAHASQFDLHEKRKPADRYNPMLFSDRETYLERLKKIREKYEKMVAEDK
ncbi:MAG: subclass B3 metallo-beta-lactamase [Chitinophagaceae bacterium]|nr:MAG: subclass B3 metallo-beta-lactamase [Chitinophagaceae bacterium]